MHNSDKSDKETAAVRLYMDESGTRDPGTPQAVVGGLIINRSHYDNFEPAWDDMLFRYDIKPPLHMKEFGQHGKLGSLSQSIRKELFQEVATLINTHKIASISATLSNREYETHFPLEVRNIFSVYGMCFNLAVVINHKLAEGRYAGKIPVILDIGNPYADHVRNAHVAILELQKEGTFLHAGGLHFDDDAEFGVLQAADVIAWGIRRRASGKAFPPGLEPIADILIPEQAHHDNSWKTEWLAMIGDSTRRALAAVEAKNKELEDDKDF